MADYTVAAVDEALALLLLVAQSPGLGVTELSVRSGNTKARTFRLLYTLEQRGLLHRAGDTPTYHLGYKALYLGVAAQEQVSLVRVARSHLRDIGGICNENVQVRVRDGLEMVCVARWESTQAIRVHTDVGNRRPLYAGASGKVLLAHAPQAVQDAVLAGALTRFTDNTIVDRHALEQELQQVLAQGYAVSFAERSSGAVAIAAPIMDADGAVIASLSVAGPASRINADNLQGFIDLVVQRARDLSLGLGYAYR
ncbi:IclR family transcriptional regulator [Collimonas pratensis]|uniref:Bacterial transcriptional regulator family protein n=1 Tax=Collimonas pratensis TaxID=279113 RepID=A0A127PXF8_9BURK|nr:IclR family transcriptional regulator [Collimonas pratensis]AMP02477.1 bacterial transcriptional regulator family protein [Collimonas pratensis]